MSDREQEVRALIDRAIEAVKQEIVDANVGLVIVAFNPEHNEAYCLSVASLVPAEVAAGSPLPVVRRTRRLKRRNL